MSDHAPIHLLTILKGSLAKHIFIHVAMAVTQTDAWRINHGTAQVIRSDSADLSQRDIIGGNLAKLLLH